MFGGRAFSLLLLLARTAMRLRPANKIIVRDRLLHPGHRVRLFRMHFDSLPQLKEHSTALSCQAVGI